MTRRVPSWVPGFALVALAVLPYLRALDDPLLHDDRTVLSSPWLARDANVISVFGADFFKGTGTRHEGARLYRPITSLSLAWNLRVAGSRAGIHGANLVLHALAVLAVAWLLRRVLGGDPPAAAWTGAALFAVHPLASEAVLWAVGRAEILAALFGCVAFVLFLDAVEGEGARGWRYPVSLAAFFLALGSKESAASWLAIAAAAVALIARPRWRRAAVLGAGHLGVLAVFVGLRAAALGAGMPRTHFVDNPLVLADPATRAANAVLLLGRYGMKAVFPGVLSIEYGFDQIPLVPLVPWGVAGAVALLAGFAAALAILSRVSRPAAFLLAFVPCAFAVTSNVLLPIGTIFAERLAYLPLVGVCGVFGWCLSRAAIPAPARAAALAAALAVLGTRGFARAGDYRDLATLREATAAASPRAVKALYNVGRVRLRQGRAAEAADALERAAAIWPDYAAALDLLSQAYAAQGLAERAQEAERRARAAAARAAPPEETEAPEEPRGGVR